MLSAIDRSSTILVIDPPLAIAGSLVTYARRAGKIVIWSPALLTNYGLTAMKSYMRNVDYLILNRQEARALTSMEDGIQACNKLSRSLDTKKKVVVTLGGEGCLLCTNRKSLMIPPLHLTSYDLK